MSDSDELIAGIEFLKRDYARAHREFTRAARYAADDPEEALSKVRKIIEAVLRGIAARPGGPSDEGASAESLLSSDAVARVVPGGVRERLGSILADADIGPAEAAALEPQAVVGVLHHLRAALWELLVPATSPASNAARERTLVWDREHPECGVTLKLMDRFRFYSHQRHVILEALAGGFAWPEKARSLAYFAINELVDNAFEHGCRGRGNLSVTYRLEMHGPTLCVTVNDEGDGFDFAAVTARRIELDPERQRGHGLIYIRHVASDLVFADGGRTVRLVLDRDALERSPALPPSALPPAPAAARARVAVDFAASEFEELLPGKVFAEPTLEELMRRLRTGPI